MARGAILALTLSLMESAPVDLHAARRGYQRQVQEYFDTEYKERMPATAITTPVQEAAIAAANQGLVTTTVQLKLPIWQSGTDDIKKRPEEWEATPERRWCHRALTVSQIGAKGIDGLPDWCHKWMTGLVLQYVKDTIEAMQLPIQVVDGETIPEFPEFDNGDGINWVHGLATGRYRGSANRDPEPFRKHYPSWLRLAYLASPGKIPIFNKCDSPIAIAYKPAANRNNSHTRYEDSYYMLELPLYWGDEGSV